MHTPTNCTWSGSRSAVPQPRLYLKRVGRPRHLKNAPIVEAVFDVRIAPVPGVTEETFAPLRVELAGEYPNIQAQRRRLARVGFEHGKFRTDQVDEGFYGLFFDNPSTARTAQFRPDGFTFNQRQPY